MRHTKKSTARDGAGAQVSGAGRGAGRGGTPKNARVCLRAASLLWSVWCDTRCSLGMLGGGGHQPGAPMARAAAEAAIDAANGSLAWPASMLRRKGDALLDCGEMD